MRATGSKTVDVDTLKSITNYDTCDADHKVVKMFWQAFETMSTEERTLYLKYVWGRSRLPMNLDSLSRKHTIEYFKSRTKDSLPIAHTCFFRIDLPDYTSAEILKQRLLYAVQYCGDIDADR
jgi:E3 ubiquitin-protein ligase HERC2